MLTISQSQNPYSSKKTLLYGLVFLLSSMALLLIFPQRNSVDQLDLSLPGTLLEGSATPSTEETIYAYIPEAKANNPDTTIHALAFPEFRDVLVYASAEAIFEVGMVNNGVVYAIASSKTLTYANTLAVYDFTSKASRTLLHAAAGHELSYITIAPNRQHIAFVESCRVACSVPGSADIKVLDLQTNGAKTILVTTANTKTGTIPLGWLDATTVMLVNKSAYETEQVIPEVIFVNTSSAAITTLSLPAETFDVKPALDAKGIAYTTARYENNGETLVSTIEYMSLAGERKLLYKSSALVFESIEWINEHQLAALTIDPEFISEQTGYDEVTGSTAIYKVDLKDTATIAPLPLPVEPDELTYIHNNRLYYLAFRTLAKNQAPIAVLHVYDFSSLQDHEILRHTQPISVLDIF